jgi:probable phosphoglycerate mutase
MSAEDRFSGSSDPPLSDIGTRQAEAARDRLAGETISSVYASTKQRALQTATIIATPHRLTPVPVPALREIDHGRWEGERQADVVARFGDEYERWRADPFNSAPQGGEPGASVLARALPAILGIVAEHPGQTVLIVSHKATIRLLATSFLGMDPRRYRDLLAQDTACINIFDFEPGKPSARLSLWNDVSHLRETARAGDRHGL